ncbi:receptor-like protein 7 [Malus domestica]|uniref:receptor-like protein 7 n=1 Tax=Malus domestica TaxID=3750 RepID=UPI0010AB0E90|nr:receptor-like protein 7 isoform X1 [Malus domestica]XP_028957109.1 receptor-like protein 7 isoform X1 [Malus domestica]XP_028957110.1 receptor-like protein 7 isoform X1 [Malus domestica]XP_028957112.1 receptor-like protein 7 isoform X1 [Malus domestica]XP_028957113.1 receptor-like protein 7 isoform X1 [Malus domestica]XP_028957114.1 receptor-like protein 7 isoform X1 [Malus domestica]XP_028957115.1 receptor-like protein 7 isoform X1 [Malus domestica]XP_028957116.1 receptor-like protein 7 
METTYVPNTVFPGPTPISVHTYSIRKTSKEASQANKISPVEDLSPTLKADPCLIHFCNVLISLVTVKRKRPKTSKVCKSKRLQRDKNNLRPPHQSLSSSNTFLTRLAKMKTLQSFGLLFFFTICHIVTTGVYSQCLKDQQLSLLHLKNNLTFDDLGSLVSSQFVSWDSSTDCCSWIGVTCSSNGSVVGLDISSQHISGGIDSSSSLFDLQHLQSLNLADNSFVEGSRIPSAIGKLTNLRYLNFSDNHYFGKIPFEISRLTRLEILDISQSSYNGDRKPLEISKFSMLFQNLSNLTVLNLDGNNISAPVPGFFANFSKLTTLNLSDCGLRGTFPKQIFQVPTLQTIDLSLNTELRGSLPEFPKNGSLRSLILSGTSFSGLLPDSIGNLNMLFTLDLSECNFTGSIPKSIGNLTKLVDLDASSNMFNGPISSIHWENLINLVHLSLYDNHLVGSIRSSLFSLPLLPYLLLSDNNFSGQLPETFNVSSSFLTSIDLSFNHLEGPVPMSIFNIRGLETLTLSSNNFSAFPFNCPQLPNLTEIDLSHNSLRTFPVFLRNQTYLTKLDLSENQIQGQLPNWIWKLDSLDYLNVSHNALESLEGPFINPTSSMSRLDLHSNQLKGPILIVPPNAEYLDYSKNHFSSSIPVSICYATSLLALDLSSNSLSGEIPQCLAAMSRLVILNVRKNNITGMISNLEFPENCESLQALDLSQNQIEGQFPKSLARCRWLKFLNLAENQITDTFPCLLKNISDLRVLALRSNNFYGGIGCPVVKTNATWSALQIIDLAYNNFNGEVPGFPLTTWQAMKGNRDISDSNYIELSSLGHGHISTSTSAALNPNEPAYGDRAVFTFSYEPAITITSKGLKWDLAKIISVLTLIDFSCNNFSGSIPKEMGALKSLYFLNLSSNAFTGEIPSSFGNMRQLESLDLSHNKLSGQIPQQLANLSFLAFLNLSNNQLVGKIPAGTQISTFPRDSFTGNKRLWGPPLTVDNKAGLSPPPLNGSRPNSTNEIDWDLISVEIGFVFGFAVAVGSLVFFKRWSKWYYRAMYKILVRIFPQLEERIGPHRRHVHINQRWRR